MSRIHIHTPQERTALRRRSELRARCSLVQMLCTVSILRTALTRILPLAGTSAWWVTLLSLLPGAVVFLLCALAMRLTRTPTLTELARRCLGPGGAWLLCGTMALLLLADGASSVTALITLFTEGIGTRGTRLTLAILTGIALCACLHREGLPRGVQLLRWPLLAGALIAAVTQASSLRADHLFPLLGDGLPSAAAALRAGVSLGWPLLLLLMLPWEEASPRFAAVSPIVPGVVVPLLLLLLAVPHEALLRPLSLAGSLMLPARHAGPAVQMLVHCLQMLGGFLGVAGASALSADFIGAPLSRRPGWLPCAAAIALTFSQALDVSALWRALSALSPWLLLPPAVLGAVLFTIAVAGRDRP